MKTSHYEWERDHVGEPERPPRPIQTRVRRWLDLAQEFFRARDRWDGDDDPTPSAA